MCYFQFMTSGWVYPIGHEVSVHVGHIRYGMPGFRNYLVYGRIDTI